MAIRNALLIIESKGQLAATISKWLRSQGRHSIWVKTVDVIGSLLESNDKILAILLIGDDSDVEGSLVNNLMILKQWSPKVPIVVSTMQNDPALEKKIRRLGVFYFDTEIGGMDDLKTAVVCALDTAQKENFFLTPPRGGG